MRRQMCKMCKTKPYDAEIEYLQNTDKQYIDTQFIPIDTPRIIVEVLFDDTADTDLFGFRNNAAPCYIGNINRVSNGISYIYYRYYNSSYYVSSGGRYICDVTVYHTLDIGHIIKIDDTICFEGTGKKSFEKNNRSVWLFHGRNSYKRCKIKTCKLYDGDIIKRDMIAVRKGGIGYMYDRVSGELFGNVGTGEFSLGPDKV